MNKKALLTLFLVTFVDLLGFGIVIPILPYYAMEFGAGGTEIGFLMAIFSIGQFFFAPLWGSLSDRIGRKPVLLISVLVTAASMVLMGLANSLMTLMIARLLVGIGSANISTAYAYVSDVTDEKNRAKGMGIVGASFGLGFIFGPALGGILSTHGYDLPMFVGAGLAALNAILVFALLPEPNISAKERAAHRTPRFDLQVVQTAFLDPKTARPIFAFFLTTFALVQMEVVFALFLKSRFGIEARQAGILLAVSGIIMVLIQGGLIGKLVKKFGELKLIQAGAWIGATGFLAFGLSQSYSVTLAAIVIMSLAQGIMSPSLSSWCSTQSSPSTRGLTMGVYHSSGSLARALSPIVAGLMFERISMLAPFVLAAVSLAVTWVITIMKGKTS